jgi:hypothetical protein
MKKRSRIIYFGFIAFLVSSENIGNFYSLIGPLKNTADLMGVSVVGERIRLVILIFLDAIPAIGAVLSIWGYRNSEAARAGRIGVVITTVGMLAYGGYQFWAATFQLGFMPNFHKLVGVMYATLGIIAWFVGGDLRKGLSSPNQSMQVDQPTAGH